jgi:hypothetical protein
LLVSTEEKDLVSARKLAGKKRTPQEGPDDEGSAKKRRVAAWNRPAGDNDTTTEEPAVASRGVANEISPEIRGRGIASNATWRERIFEEHSEMED